MRSVVCIFCFNDTATTEIYTLSLHDALPISDLGGEDLPVAGVPDAQRPAASAVGARFRLAGDAGEDAEAQQQRLGAADQLLRRSEEHTSELQSRQYLVCRLLLEKNILTALPPSRVI